MTLFSLEPDTLYIFPSALARAQRLMHSSQLTPGMRQESSVSCGGFLVFEDLLQLLTRDLAGRPINSFQARLALTELGEKLPEAYRKTQMRPRGQRRALQAFLELRHAGIISERLGQGGSPELQDLACALSYYEGSLASRGWVDSGDVMRHAAWAASRRPLASPLRGAQKLIVLPGVELTSGRLDILAALASRHLSVEVNIPYDAHRPAALAWGEHLLWQLDSRGLDALRVIADGRVGVGPLALARGTLFSPAGSATSLEKEPVWLLPTTTQQEAVRAAAQVAAGFCAAGTPVEKIAIVLPVNLPQIDSVVARLVAECKLLEIPAVMQKPVALFQTGLGKLMARIIKMAAEEQDAESGFDVADLLALWRFRRFQEISVLPFHDVADWLRGTGLSRIALTEFPSALARAQSRRSDEITNVTSETLIDFASRLSGLARCSTFGEWLDELFELVLGPHNLFWEKEHQPRYAEDFLRVLGLLRKQSEEFSQEKDETWPRSNFAEVFLEFLQREFVAGDARPHEPTLTLVNADELVGASFTKVIIFAVDRNIWPAATPPVLPLSQALRQEINQRVGPRLVSYAAKTGKAPMPATARDVWLFAEALLAARDEAVVVYTAGEEGAEEDRSELISELLLRKIRSRPLESFPERYGDAHRLLLLAHHLSLGAHPTDPVALLQTSDTRGLWPRARALVSRALAVIQIEADSHFVLTRDVGEKIKARLETEVQSVSHLDTLGMCRYRFFAESILKLQPSPVASLGLGPKERGSAAHSALWVTYLGLVKNDKLAWARANPQAAHALARTLFDQKETEILRGIRVHEDLRQAALGDAWQAVETQLAVDLKPSDEGPLWLEYRFGGRGRAEAAALELTLPSAPYRLFVRGAIDRVDEAPNFFDVVDYKSSRPEGRTPGRRFQLPLYAAVVARDVSKDSGPEVRAQWRTLWGGASLAASEVTGHFAAQADALAISLSARLTPLTEGSVAADPDDPRICVNCDYRGLCRVPKVLHGESS